MFFFKPTAAKLYKQHHSGPTHTEGHTSCPQSLAVHYQPTHTAPHTSCGDFICSVTAKCLFLQPLVVCYKLGTYPRAINVFPLRDMMGNKGRVASKPKTRPGCAPMFPIPWMCVQAQSLPPKAQHVRGKLLRHVPEETDTHKRTNCGFKPRCQHSQPARRPPPQYHPCHLLTGDRDTTSTATCLGATLAASWEFPSSLFHEEAGGH